MCLYLSFSLCFLTPLSVHVFSLHLPPCSHCISNYHPLEGSNLDQQGTRLHWPTCLLLDASQGNTCLGVKHTTQHQSAVKGSRSEGWLLLQLGLLTLEKRMRVLTTVCAAVDVVTEKQFLAVKPCCTCRQKNNQKTCRKYYITLYNYCTELVIKS